MGLFDGLDSLTSGIQSVTTGLSSAALSPAPPNPLSDPAPIYGFELWQDNGSGLAEDVDLAGVAAPLRVAFRFPPNSIQFERGIRAEVMQDLSGNGFAVEGGLGLGRFTLRGSHGAGGARSTDREAKSAALDRVEALRRFFEGWAAVNRERAKASGRPLQIAFHISGGSWSDYANEVWLIYPMAMPSEGRDSSRPLAWDWSMSFWVLGKPEPLTSQYRLPLTSSAKLSELKGLAAKVQKAAQDARALLQPVQDLGSKMLSLAAGVQQLRDAGIREISGLGDSISQVALGATSILSSTNPSNVFDDTTSAYRSALINCRTAAGEAKRWTTTEGTSGSLGASSTPILAPVSPGGAGLQQVAALQAGSSNAWQRIADANGLRYPYVSG